ncbi:SECR protein, partial [Eudromia elegans]|nr:SECR protein [Eudromia elegans]
MVALRTGLWRLIIPMIVISHFSASLPVQERTKIHADGLFHNELSKMHDKAHVQQLVKHPMGLKERFQRHSDGLFTSEYSKMRGNARVQKFIQNLMGRKRSSLGSANADVMDRKEKSHEDHCFMWLYQSFLNASRSSSDAREAAALTSQYICPFPSSW